MGKGRSSLLSRPFTNSEIAKTGLKILAASM
jgi:hypothetical protein